MPLLNTAEFPFTPPHFFKNIYSFKCDYFVNKLIEETTNEIIIFQPHLTCICALQQCLKLHIHNPLTTHLVINHYLQIHSVVFLRNLLIYSLDLFY